MRHCPQDSAVCRRRQTPMAASGEGETRSVYVVQRHFRRVRRGYDPVEVDRHLQLVSEWFCQSRAGETARELEKQWQAREREVAAGEERARRLLESKQGAGRAQGALRERVGAGEGQLARRGGHVTRASATTAPCSPSRRRMVSTARPPSAPSSPNSYSGSPTGMRAPSRGSSPPVRGRAASPSPAGARDPCAAASVSLVEAEGISTREPFFIRCGGTSRREAYDRRRWRSCPTCPSAH
jgi:DivIVA domain-containing protein